jgi:hypothetical protein
MHFHVVTLLRHASCHRRVPVVECVTKMRPNMPDLTPLTNFIR